MLDFEPKFWALSKWASRMVYQFTPLTRKYRRVVSCILDQGLAKSSPKSNSSPKSVCRYSFIGTQPCFCSTMANLHNCHRLCGLQSWKYFCYLPFCRKMGRPTLVIIISAHQISKKESHCGTPVFGPGEFHGLYSSVCGVRKSLMCLSNFHFHCCLNFHFCKRWVDCQEKVFHIQLLSLCTAQGYAAEGLNWSQPCTSQGFQGCTSGKDLACQCRRHERCEFDPWVRKIPWRRKWQPTPVFLPGESHGPRSLAGTQWDMTEATEHSPCGSQIIQKQMLPVEGTLFKFKRMLWAGALGNRDFLWIARPGLGFGLRDSEAGFQT